MGNCFSLSYSLGWFMRSFRIFYDNCFLSIMLTFSKVFGCSVIIFDYLTDFVFFLLINDWYCSLALLGSAILFRYFSCKKKKNVQMFYWITTVFLRKFNVFIIVFRDQVSDFIDWHLFFFIALAIFRMYIILYGNTTRNLGMTKWKIA